MPLNAIISEISEMKYKNMAKSIKCSVIKNCFKVACALKQLEEK